MKVYLLNEIDEDNGINETLGAFTSYEKAYNYMLEDIKERGHIEPDAVEFEIKEYFTIKEICVQ